MHNQLQAASRKKSSPKKGTKRDAESNETGAEKKARTEASADC